MITRSDAIELLHTHMKSQNLRRHCYAVEAVMRSLARRFGKDEEIWGIAGLLHDADYEITKDDPARHTHLTLDWFKPIEVHKDISEAILAHGYGYVDGNPKPKNEMEWSLYCCDELTGFIVAVTLVKPDHKLASVTLESIMKKWNQKAFAAGVNRKQIEECEAQLNIPLPEFVALALESMQEIATDLGL
jgi:putative nucleotidyltransferase with HDIG domain